MRYHLSLYVPLNPTLIMGLSLVLSHAANAKSAVPEKAPELPSCGYEVETGIPYRFDPQTGKQCGTETGHITLVGLSSSKVPNAEQPESRAEAETGRGILKPRLRIAKRSDRTDPRTPLEGNSRRRRGIVTSSAHVGRSLGASIGTFAGGAVGVAVKIGMIGGTVAIPIARLAANHPSILAMVIP